MMPGNGDAVTGPVARIYRFGVYEFDPSQGLLRRSGVRLRLPPQPLGLLELLLEADGKVVSRDDIRNRLWPEGVHVDFDRAVGKAILKLRSVLGDDAFVPRYIETLPKIGYRFVAPVQRVVEHSGGVPVNPDPNATATLKAADRAFYLPALRRYSTRTALLATGVVALAVAAFVSFRSWTGQLGTEIESIAVLPFENLTGDPGEDYLAHGIAQELTVALGRIGDLHVVPGRAGTPSDVEALVKGAVARSSRGLRITAYVVDAAKGNRIWTAVHDWDRGDFPRLRAELAQQLAVDLRRNLSSADLQRLTASRTIDPRAYDHYVHGRYFWDKRTTPDIYKAIEYFRQAIRIEPSFAKAHASIALAYAPLIASGSVRPTDFVPAIANAAARAQEFDDSLSETHAALALVAVHNWDWQRWESELLRAIELNPHDPIPHLWLGWHYETLLRFEENLRARRKAYALDPTKPMISSALAGALALSGNKQAAEVQFMKAIELAPESPVGHTAFGIFLEQEGRLDEAIRELERGNAPEALAHAYALSGRRSDALKLLARMDADAKHRYVSPFSFALVHAGLGAAERALDWLERAYEERDQKLHRLQVDSRLDLVRFHPRYQRLLARMRFPGQ